MKEILSADLYRLGKQKSTWILPLATFVIAFLFGMLYGAIFGNASFLNDFHDMMKQGVSSVGGTTGAGQGGDVAFMFSAEFNSLADYVATVFEHESFIAIVIFVSVYASAVKRNGFVKNIGRRYNSFQYNASQAIIILGYSVLITFVNLLATVSSALIFFEGIEPGNFWSLLSYFLIVALLHYAASLMIVILCDFFKNNNAGIIIGCILGALSKTLCDLLNALIKLIADTGFTINHLFPFAYATSMRYGVTSSYLYGLALAAIYTVLFFLMKIPLKKKDVV